MKKILFLMLAICALALMLVSCNKGTEGLEFVEINEEEYGVKCGEAINESEIVIPKKYDGKPVTTILKSGFSKCENLTSITIPKSITKMEIGAFLNCDKLENVYYGGKLDEWCSIEIEHSTANPMNIGKHFFIKGNEITEISITDVAEIKAYAFFSFDMITKISINGATTIGENAFAGCSSVCEITLNGVQAINKLAFSSCTKLENIVIPNSVTLIHPLAFYGCNELDAITFEEIKGWFFASKETDTSGTKIDVSDAGKNAKALTQTGTDFWKHN